MLTLSLIVAALLTTTHAFNDWSQPCTTGSCWYDIASDASTVPASLSFNGSNQTLSDITPAAGWEIWGCDSNWSDGLHAVLMVCTGTAEQMANCDHLYAHGGAPHTVVRLPESCGTGPFAHVNSTFTPTNQSTPLHLMRRDGSSPDVHGLVLDYDFKSIPASWGTLNFSVVSSPNDSQMPMQSRSRSRVHMPRAVRKASPVATAAPAATTSQSLKSTTIPLKLTNQSFSLANASIDCTTSQHVLRGKASLKIAVDTEVDAALVYSFSVLGSVGPTLINSFSMSSSLTGQALATFHIANQAQGSFNTGSLTIFKAGLPGLSLPGLLTLGPSFTITAATKIANVNFETALSMTSAVNFPSLLFNFPPGSKQTPESVLPQVDPNTFQLAASNATADFTGSITGHIIPSVKFGVSLGGSIGASLFINMDMSTAAGLTFKAGAAAAAQPAVSPVARRATSSPNGCVDVSVGLKIDAGLTGSLPGAGTSQSFPLFNQGSSLFNKCVGTGANGTAAPVPSARSISTGGSTIARASRLARVNDVEKRVPAAPFNISPAKPAAPVVASSTATGVITQPTLSASGQLINQIKPQTSDATKAALTCSLLSISQLLSTDTLPRVV